MSTSSETASATAQRLYYRIVVPTNDAGGANQSYFRIGAYRQHESGENGSASSLPADFSASDDTSDGFLFDTLGHFLIRADGDHIADVGGQHITRVRGGVHVTDVEAGPIVQNSKGFWLTTDKETLTEAEWTQFKEDQATSGDYVADIRGKQVTEVKGGPSVTRAGTGPIVQSARGILISSETGGISQEELDAFNADQEHNRDIHIISQGGVKIEALGSGRSVELTSHGTTKETHIGDSESFYQGERTEHFRGTQISTSTAVSISASVAFSLEANFSLSLSFDTTSIGVTAFSYSANVISIGTDAISLSTERIDLSNKDISLRKGMVTLGKKVAELKSNAISLFS